MSAPAYSARPPAPLSGALGTVPLTDVLQLLDLGRKTGVLAVDGGDGRRGLVALADGAITGACYEDARPDGPSPRPTAGRAADDVVAAVGALLGLSAGRFAFTPSDRPAGAGPRHRVESVLMAALHAADERARPPADEPPPGPVPALSAAGAAPLALRARHWAVLAAVDGTRDVAAIAAASGRADAADVLAELAAAGLVTSVRPDGAARAVPRTPLRSSAF